MLVAPTSVALPVIRSLSDCANYDRVVAPYLPQLYTLPHDVFQYVTNLEELKGLYLSTNPLVTAIAFSLVLSPLALIVSEINKNYSQVDRVWSILPTIYNLHYAFWARASGVPSQRLDTLAACSVIWSIRLTFNYWRRGGYKIGSEDYRWEIVKARIGPALFFVLNVIFIAFIQNLLLMAITFPTYVILQTSRISPEQMSTSDIVMTRIMAGVVLLEFFADQQQWDYHKAKHQYQKTAKVPPKYRREDLDRGFNTAGLWGFSRHPNFLAEMTFWVTLYQWSCFASQTVWSWAGIGALCYVGLFQASTLLTEYITAGKYPEYKEYQRTVGKFLPKIFPPVGPPA